MRLPGRGVTRILASPQYDYVADMWRRLGDGSGRGGRFDMEASSGDF